MHLSSVKQGMEKKKKTLSHHVKMTEYYITTEVHFAVAVSSAFTAALHMTNDKKGLLQMFTCFH